MPSIASWPSLFIVRGASMEPSLYDGDLLFVSKPRRAPRRGNIVMIDTSHENGVRWQVKRVVGLPGDGLVFENGLLFINGIPHPEPYLRGLPAYLGLDKISFDVGEGHYFVLGDNRSHSTDSRAYGAIEARRVAGLVAGRLWPISRRTVR